MKLYYLSLFYFLFSFTVIHSLWTPSSPYKKSIYKRDST